MFLVVGERVTGAMGPVQTLSAEQVSVGVVVAQTWGGRRTCDLEIRLVSS